MNKINPLFDAVSEIDDKTVADFIPKYKTKPRKALKIAVITVAAALLLGTTAAATTLGDNPIVKINNNQVVPLHSSYVDENGWTVETTAVRLPFDTTCYTPVGEVRAVFDSELHEDGIYDELGVRLDDVSNGINFYINAEKNGEIPMTLMHGCYYDNYHQHETITPEGEIIIEFWQDPIQALESANRESMTVDEKLEEWRRYGNDFLEYGGFEHPSMRELYESGSGVSVGSADVHKFESTPSEAMKLYGYAPVSMDGCSEKAGMTAVMYKGTDNDTGEYTIFQQMFVYTLVDEQSGAEIVFTVWRSAENKDTYTDHFDFEYEYIQLNTGTQARLHQSADNSYILEFEKDGAAYGLQLGRERNLAESILEKMELL
ncbi:MAG: hypothetical protein K2N38_01680 [Oscillospiraceae bacterium]|nr:hypothetical protein [Oscillospiraceae bacterium]